jgi:sulfite exporter TauE/SafE
MIDLPLVFIGGLLGSAHCVGMCGPLAMMVGSGAGRLTANLRRQAIYSAGRVFTYGCGGAAAAFASTWLAGQARTLVAAQAWLAITAGCLLVAVGLASAGVLPMLNVRLLRNAPCHAAHAIKTLTTAPDNLSLFLAGVATGFIPCGLVYAFLLKAGSTGSIGLGAMTMILFGLGTAPLMIIVGTGGALLSISARARILRLAAWCVVVAGLVTIARGVSQVKSESDMATAPCPFCVPGDLSRMTN